MTLMTQNVFSTYAQTDNKQMSVYHKRITLSALNPSTPNFFYTLPATIYDDNERDPHGHLLLSRVQRPVKSHLIIISKIIKVIRNAIHTASAPAVWAAVITELSYRKYTTITFFFPANKNKDIVKVSLASSNS